MNAHLDVLVPCLRILQALLTDDEVICTALTCRTLDTCFLRGYELKSWVYYENLPEVPEKLIVRSVCAVKNVKRLRRHKKLVNVGFDCSFNKRLKRGDLPSTIESLYFFLYDQPIDAGVLPGSLTDLHLSDDFNQPLEVGVLPESLWRFRFNDTFDQPLKVGVLPNSLRSLEFGNGFNQPLVVGVFPSTLVHLSFGDYFDQPLTPGVFPSTLRRLHFGDEFDQPIEVGVLPESLEYVSFGAFFNQLFVPGALPTSLCELRILHKYYRHPFGPGVLPESLKRSTCYPGLQYKRVDD